MAKTVDVLIAGAGPTGLMLACWLARYGIKALVVDPKDGPSKETRALVTQARSMETYDMLGLGERVRREGIQARRAAMWSSRRCIGHAELAEIGHGTSPHPYLFILGQDHTERLLYDDLREHGGEVAWGVALEGLTQDAGAVHATLAHPDGRREAVTAKYLAGCDGAKSPVRHALGIAFEGGSYDHRFYVADVTAEGPLAEGELSICFSGRGFLACFPMPGPGRFRFVGMVPDARAKDPHVGFEDIRAMSEEHSGMRTTAVHWFATYNVHHLVAAHFQQGRAFLLGDAGHVHSPVGGQGMNTGLMDASNLGWKLAQVLRGEAPERLLETYEAERRPFAIQLVETTDRVFSVVSSDAPLANVMRDWILPVAFAFAANTPGLRSEAFGLVSQTRIHYPHSPLSRGSAGHVKGGDRLPWVRYPDGSSNFDSLTALQPQLHVYGQAPAGLEAFAAEHGLPLTRLPGGREVRSAGLAENATYLVRPDGYVAFAGRELAALEAYLHEAWGWEASTKARQPA